MAYRDTWATCAQCEKQFIFRVEEQRRQAERGEDITAPELCPSCRTSARTASRPAPKSQPRSRPRAEQKPEAAAVLGPGPHEGSVKWYDGERGYGFIVQRSGEDIFFHRTGIAAGESPSFHSGTRVTYLIEHTEKGPQAVDVAPMDVKDSA
ncbi:MAG: cold shock domain-containing protein [Anaerolineae bacterium]|jgi:CspA family cold shock protein